MYQRRLAEAAAHAVSIDRELRDLRDDMAQERNRYLKLIERKPVQKALVGFNFATSTGHIGGR